jgi:hypothetical protein
VNVLNLFDSMAPLTDGKPLTPRQQHHQQQPEAQSVTRDTDLKRFEEFFQHIAVPLEMYG